MSTALQPPPIPANSSFRPRSRGLELDVNEFGFLRDSSDAAGRPELCHQRIQDDGYLYLPGFFRREEVLEARDVVTDRLMANGFLDERFPAGEAVVKNIKIANSQSAFRPDGDPTTLKTYKADDFTGNNPPLEALMHQGKLRHFFEGYFSRDVVYLNYTWFRVVSPGVGTPPHCDIVYMGRGTKNLLTTWLPVGDAPLHVGGLMILENSHKQTDRLRNYLSRDVDEYCANGPNAEKIESGEMMMEWDGWLTKDPVSLREKLGGRWLTADYHAGDVLIFTMHTIHASLDNQSDRIRLSADFRYQPADEPMDERFAVDNPVPYARQFKKGRIC
jgi:hypothetical protein